MSNKKTIVQILRAPIGGIRKHVVDIITSLGNENCNQLFITNTKDTDFDLSELNQIKNLKIIHLDIKDSPGIGDLKNLFKVFWILKSEKNLIVHGHGAKGGLYSRLSSKLIGAKSIYTPHGGSLHRVFGFLKNTIFDFVEKILVYFTDLFIFESKYTAETFLKNVSHISNYKINYNGIDFPNQNTEQVYIAGETIHLASFGLLRELKGHSIMIAACRRLKADGIKFTYDIYGNGELESDLKKQISDLALTNEVRLMGYSKDVVSDMRKYHVIVQPSLFESFGYVPVEAMALKIPVIVSNNGGLKEVVPSTQYGLIAKNNSPEEYYQIIKSIYKNETNLKNIIDQAFVFAKENFSKETMIKNLKSFYEL